MALIFSGKMPCARCGNILLEGEPVKSFPPLADTAHPLHAYFDQGFHAACFDGWAHKDEAARLRQDQQRLFKARPEVQARIQKYGEPDWLKDSE